MATSNRYTQRPRSATTASRPTPGRRRGTPIRRTAPPPRSNRKPWLLAAATLVVLGLGFSVMTHMAKVDPGVPRAGCVIAVDAQWSASTMTDAYRQWLPRQAEDCAADTRADLNIALVSGETRTSTVTPVSTQLSRLDFTGNESTDSTIVKNEIDRVVKKADNAILSAPEQRGGTDIIGVLCVAHDLLAGNTPSTLIIDTDGINNHAPYRLEMLPLDDAKITEYVDQLKADGQLCDLTGTQVHMYGVGIGQGTSDMSGEQLTGVHRFWEAAIRATGATLVNYQRNP